MEKQNVCSVILTKLENENSVYIVRNNDNTYCLKIFQKNNSKYKREITMNNIVEGLNCIPKLVKILENNEKVGLLFEYVGLDLFELHQEIYFDTDVLRKYSKFYIVELLLGISEIHKRGIYHGDLKLENLCISNDGHLYIIDFGLSRLVDIKTGLCHLSNKNNLSGTILYLSPEIFLRKEYGFAADWWAFGLLINEFLTGDVPWYSDSPIRNRKNILEKELYRNPMLTDLEFDLISKLLEKDPSKRLKEEDIFKHEYFKDIDFSIDRNIPGPFTHIDKLKDLSVKFIIDFPELCS